ncbi:hypothetical protein TNCV_3930521 [Trichonephila clavipes]|nr:hypothetical protein TNCV_3930521 [Trichonephila clavipes]
MRGYTSTNNSKILKNTQHLIVLELSLNRAGSSSFAAPGKESLSIPSFLYVSDSPLVSMKRKKGRRTAADNSQAGRCGSQNQKAVFARRRS